MERYFGFERLDVYRLAVEVARWAARQGFPARRKHLADQLVRAADSRQNHYRIAKGSAAEVFAVLDLADLPETRRIDAMLQKMTR